MNADPDAERAVLAACILSRTAREEARRHLVGLDFNEPAHEQVWQAMSRLDRHGKGVDPTTIHAALGTNRQAVTLLPDLVTLPVVAEHVTEYAAIVRGWSVKRRLYAEAVRTQQEALNPDVSAQGLAATVATRFAQVRDSGVTEDAQSITLDELVAVEDTEPEWLIPGLLERCDRLILTGEEGLGKSHLLRQIAVMSAAGLHPFDPGHHIPPVPVTIVDCENSQPQVRRRVRQVLGFAKRYGQASAGMVNLLCSHRLDLARDRDLAMLHRELDATQPALVVIGPLYRLAPRALQTDDEAAPILAALDTLRERGCALLIEAHAGHAIGRGGTRELRPRGSSALLGWPEFGYGMRAVESDYGRRAELSPWRGDRDERDWPRNLRECSQRIRWVPDDTTAEAAWA